MKKKLGVGIDLGTTNTLVGYMKNGEFEFINFKGSEILKSVISYENSRVFLGKAAINKGKKNAKNFIKSSKRFMGDGNKIWEIEDREFTPTDVACEILKEAYKNLKLENPEVEEFEAIITVPAYFETRQIEETRKAAINAKFKIKQILPEPVAAATAYGYEEGKNQRLLVVDIGGGTFDVALLDINSESLKVIDYAGDNMLGGDDFDEVILELIYNQVRKDEFVDLSTFERSWLDSEEEYTQINSRLRTEAENIKIELSSHETTELELPHLLENYNLEMEITKAEFEEKSEELFEKIDIILDDFLSEHSISEIDKVVLVGGTSRIPKIKEMIEEKVEREIYSDKPLDKLVVMGASILATQDNTLQIRIDDILSHSIGLAIGENHENYYIMLKKNTIYPTERTVTFPKSFYDQIEAELKIYEGEDPNPKKNTHYGDMTIEGIRKGYPEDIEFDVTFKIDKNKILEITAKDRETGKKTSKKLKIKQT